MRINGEMMMCLVYLCRMDGGHYQNLDIFFSKSQTYSLISSTSTELLSLEKAVCAWAEWEGALRELQGALRGDLATLQALRDRGDQTEIANQIRQLAASLVEKKKVSASILLT